MVESLNLADPAYKFSVIGKFETWGAKWTLRKLRSTRASHKYSPSQLPNPPAGSLPRSGLVQDYFCDPNILRHDSDRSPPD